MLDRAASRGTDVSATWRTGPSPLLPRPSPTLRTACAVHSAHAAAVDLDRAGAVLGSPGAPAAPIASCFTTTTIFVHMGRWTQYDEVRRPGQPRCMRCFSSLFRQDSYRLPEGMKRVGYDSDTGRYQFRDQDGALWEGPEGAQFGEMKRGASRTTTAMLPSRRSTAQVLPSARSRECPSRCR